MKKTTLTDKITGKEFQLDEEKVIRIGRSKYNEIITPKVVNIVSRSHAIIAYNEGLERYVIFDNFSKNGMYVNGIKVDRTVLEGEKEISLGEKGYALKFKEENKK